MKKFELFHLSRVLLHLRGFLIAQNIASEEDFTRFDAENYNPLDPNAQHHEETKIAVQHLAKDVREALSEAETPTGKQLPLAAFEKQSSDPSEIES